MCVCSMDHAVWFEINDDDRNSHKAFCKPDCVQGHSVRKQRRSLIWNVHRQSRSISTKHFWWLFRKRNISKYYGASHSFSVTVRYTALRMRNPSQSSCYVSQSQHVTIYKHTLESLAEHVDISLSLLVSTQKIHWHQKQIGPKVDQSKGFLPFCSA